MSSFIASLFLIVVILLVASESKISERPTVGVCSREPDDGSFISELANHNKSMQSPVNINTKGAIGENFPDLVFGNYFENHNKIVKLMNDGYTVETLLASDEVEVLEEDRPYITGGPLEKDMFLFENMHFHWGETDGDGSEHELDGRKFSTEMHIVHFKKEYGTMGQAKNCTDGVAVVTFFGEVVDKDNQDLNNYFDDMKFVRVCNSTFRMPVSTTFEVVKKHAQGLDEKYYTYHGSLTTNPFSEAVTWIVFAKPFTLSSHQLSEFRQLRSCNGSTLIRKNDRKLQKFNGRPIRFNQNHSRK